MDHEKTELTVQGEEQTAEVPEEELNVSAEDADAEETYEFDDADSEEEGSSGDYDLAEGEKAADKQKLIRVLVAAAAIIVCAFFIFTTGEDGEGYLIKIPTDDGYTWECTDFDETMLTMTSEGLEEDGGSYKGWFQGLAEGDAEIDVIRYADGDSSNVVEERTYHVKVLEDGTVIHRAVDRTLLEN